MTTLDLAILLTIGAHFVVWLTHEYTLIWHSQYSKEEVDCFQNHKEAKRMQAEYIMAFGEGRIEIKKRRA